MEGEFKEKEKIKFGEKLELDVIDKSNDKSFIRIHCPSCSESIMAEDINIQDKICKCGHCHVVFSIEHSTDALKSNPIKEEIQRPEGVDLIYFKDDLEISVKQPQMILDIILISLVPFISIFAFLLYFLKGEEMGMPIGLISMAISSAVIFRMLRNKRNKIYLLLTEKELAVEWRPNNLIKDKHYNIEDIDQIYVKNTPEGIALYMVVNTVNGQSHQKLIARMDDISKARYIEQEMERYMGITDKRVMGELQ